ncbi:MAG: hypothetical protein H7138_26580, partial [Myxococcales bacterium]|nr:hypothetical protein [Myxococcales bacterium]
MVRAATIAALIAVLIVGALGRAHGDVLGDLGDAYRAYDAGDLPAANAKLAKLDHIVVQRPTADAKRPAKHR